MAVTDEELPGAKPAATETGASRWSRLNHIVGAVGHYTLLGLARVKRLLELTIFSSLTQRIIVLNLAGLAVLVEGILFLNQWRTGLIEARVQSLRVQGEIIAAAIAASAKRRGLTILEWVEEKETAAKSGRRGFSRMLRLLPTGGD